jgi:hypothetical protein
VIVPSALEHAVPWRMISLGVAGLSYVHPFVGSCKIVLPFTSTFTCVGSTVPRLLA